MMLPKFQIYNHIPECKNPVKNNDIESLRR